MTADIELNRGTTTNDVLVRYLTPRLKNEGALTAMHWIFEAIIPAVAVQIAVQHSLLVMEHPAESAFPKHRIFEFNSDRGPLNYQMRLLPGQSIELNQTIGFPQISVQISASNFQCLEVEIPAIYWRLYVDNCPMKMGEIPFSIWCTY